MRKADDRRALIGAIFTAHRVASGVIQMRTRVGVTSGGVTLPRVFLLRLVVTRGKSSSRDLAAAMGVTTANLPGLLDKLESDGFITRTRGESDRRVVYVEATSEGRKKLRELWRAAMRELAKEFEGWSDSELRALRDMLRRIASSPRSLSPASGPLSILPNGTVQR